MTERNPIKIGSSRTNRYTIQRELGRGGGGTVYLVYDNNLKQQKVLKEIVLSKCGGEQSFQTEVEVLKNIRHPGIPTIIDAWADGVIGEPVVIGFIVMDYCHGMNLKEYMSNHRLELIQQMEIFRQIAQIIYVLHSNNPRVIHGDIKPENIMVDAGRVSLLDFGAAVVDSKKNWTQNVGPVGLSDLQTSVAFTPGYAAPALQESGRHMVENDFYALGMVLFFLITGRDVRSFPQSKVSVEDFPDTTPRQIQYIFSQCISGYHHILELLEDLNSFMLQLESKRNKKAGKKHRVLLKNTTDMLVIRFLNYISNQIVAIFRWAVAKKKNSYRRLEAVVLTDGGHVFF